MLAKAIYVCICFKQPFYVSQQTPLALSNCIVHMLSGSVTACLIGYLLLMLVKKFGRLLIEISILLEKMSRGLYYERMKLSYLCTAESHNR